MSAPPLVREPATGVAPPRAEGRVDGTRLVPRLSHPASLTWLAVLFAWAGIYAAYRGAPAGLWFGTLAAVSASLAFFRARAISARRRARLRAVMEATAAQNRALLLLRDLAGALLRVETLEELFDAATRVARDLFDAEGTAVFLVAEEGRFLRLAAGYGTFNIRPGKLLPMDRSLCGWVVTNEQGAVVRDAGTDPRVYRGDGMPIEARSALVAPLRSSGLVLGTVTVINHAEGNPFTQADLELLQTLADQVAVGLDRTRAIEERRRGLDELAEKNQELLRATRLKSEFLANMSHELRTPLNAIIGFSDLMLAGALPPLDPTQRDFLSSISRNGHHLLGLINNVLDLSKIEAGRMTYTLGPTDLRQAITGAVADTASLRAAKRQESELRLEDGPLTVQGDSQRVRQILYNLLSNASKFTAEAGKVTLSAVRTRAPLPVPSDRAGDQPRMIMRDAVWVSVSDNGIGIRPDEKPRLFDEFTQLDSSTSRVAQGTGLGLALCRKFVDAMGGTIGCESIHGTGSTFWFLLPVEGPIRRSEVGHRRDDPDRAVDGAVPSL